MADKPGELSLTRMRRADRAADDAWIRAFLRRVPFGVLATLQDGEEKTGAR